MNLHLVIYAVLLSTIGYLVYQINGQGLSTQVS